MSLVLLADNDVQGHLQALLKICRSEAWIDLWTAMDVSIVEFEDLGLRRNVPDAVLWRECQRRDIVIITGNRNRHSPDSLEAVIAQDSTPHSLPVLTLADADRVLRDRMYAEHVAEKLIERVIDIDELRGTGRVYLP